MSRRLRERFGGEAARYGAECAPAGGPRRGPVRCRRTGPHRRPPLPRPGRDHREGATLAEALRRRDWLSRRHALAALLVVATWPALLTDAPSLPPAPPWGWTRGQLAGVPGARRHARHRGADRGRGPWRWPYPRSSRRTGSRHRPRIGVHVDTTVLALGAVGWCAAHSGGRRRMRSIAAAGRAVPARRHGWSAAGAPRRPGDRHAGCAWRDGTGRHLRRGAHPVGAVAGLAAPSPPSPSRRPRHLLSTPQL